VISGLPFALAAGVDAFFLPPFCLPSFSKNWSDSLMIRFTSVLPIPVIQAFVSCDIFFSMNLRHLKYFSKQ